MRSPPPASGDPAGWVPAGQTFTRLVSRHRSALRLVLQTTVTGSVEALSGPAAWSVSDISQGGGRLNVAFMGSFPDLAQAAAAMDGWAGGV